MGQPEHHVIDRLFKMPGQIKRVEVVRRRKGEIIVMGQRFRNPVVAPCPCQHLQAEIVHGLCSKRCRPARSQTTRKSNDGIKLRYPFQGAVSVLRAGSEEGRLCLLADPVSHVGSKCDQQVLRLLGEVGAFLAMLWQNLTRVWDGMSVLGQEF